MNALLEDLTWRGLIQQSTDLEQLGRHLDEAPRLLYSGFDPTSDSLTIGNLVPALILKRFQLAGHTPVVVMGGGTGLIGDPSGKDSERLLQTREQVDQNVSAQRVIFEALLDFEGKSAARIVNNADWLTKLGYIELLRDVGKHFSVNMMVQKDSIRERLENREQGISYTEFSYMILQAYDFWHLYDAQNVTIQLGGSDQWGNIVAGLDLIRKRAQGEAFALTNPLVTKADGSKFGKTESGAVWLTRDKTSPYAFYQFWLNTADADLERYLKLFTLLGREEIDSLLAEGTKNPGARIGQQALAEHVTRLLHGEAGVTEAKSTTEALFSGNVAGLSLQALDEAFQGAPTTEHPLNELSGDGVSLVDLLPKTSLAKSKREAREFLGNGAVSVNGEKVSVDTRLSANQLLHGSVALIRRGKRNWHVTRWS